MLSSLKTNVSAPSVDVDFDALYAATLQELEPEPTPEPEEQNLSKHENPLVRSATMYMRGKGEKGKGLSPEEMIVLAMKHGWRAKPEVAPSPAPVHVNMPHEYEAHSSGSKVVMPDGSTVEFLVKGAIIGRTTKPMTLVYPHDKAQLVVPVGTPVYLSEKEKATLIANRTPAKGEQPFGWRKGAVVPSDGWSSNGKSIPQTNPVTVAPDVRKTAPQSKPAATTGKAFSSFDDIVQLGVGQSLTGMPASKGTRKPVNQWLAAQGFKWDASNNASPVYTKGSLMFTWDKTTHTLTRNA